MKESKDHPVTVGNKAIRNGSLVEQIAQVAILAYAANLAYDIRLYAIKQFGNVIHEFDPWFNYRATEYLNEHGTQAFLHWYDYMSWYPLGRPVGTTIYPGMQFIAVGIYRFLNQIASYPMSLNDVCVYIPAWFGVVASVCVGLLATECYGSRTAGAVAMLVMSCVPAHTMRSVGGGYDNESIAVSALSLTFLLWCRSLRNDSSAIPFGILSGLAYFVMVATWGGYVFVINMIGIHAVALFFLGRFSRKLYWAYTTFFIVGTLGAIQVPVVGLTPLKSLEQMGPLGAFFMFQGLYICDIIREKKNLDWKGVLKVRIAVACAGLLVLTLVVMALWPTGYFGPISSRVRGLFVKHTRTGNPLVDSVAEHQPASQQAYSQYLSDTMYLAPFGLLLAVFRHTDASLFLPLYGVVAYFFSAKMVRLIILLGPVASALSGVAIGTVISWASDQYFAKNQGNLCLKPSEAIAQRFSQHALGRVALWVRARVVSMYNSTATNRKIWSVVAIAVIYGRFISFEDYGRQVAVAMSHPSIMFFGKLRDGTQVLVDDYREAYFWLRDNTPEDARVMAWWDYGYQIAGIANRTSIADGNTWNHEHIAMLGRCLVSEEEKAHRMIRHLADYVLVWTGGGGDDVGKMPHMARIANSVFDSTCPGDPLCSQIGYVDRQGTPSEFMAKTLVYKLHSGGQKPDVVVDAKRFQNVYTSKYNKVRIWQVMNVDEESKAWNADPSNRICDHPGSWLCKGQYPPKFRRFIKEMKDFQQLEDFNRKKDESSAEYQKRYHEEMNKRHGGGH